MTSWILGDNPSNSSWALIQTHDPATFSKFDDEFLTKLLGCTAPSSRCTWTAACRTCCHGFACATQKFITTGTSSFILFCCCQVDFFCGPVGSLETDHTHEQPPFLQRICRSDLPIFGVLTHLVSSRLCRAVATPFRHSYRLCAQENLPPHGGLDVDLPEVLPAARI